MLSHKSHRDCNRAASCPSLRSLLRFLFFVFVLLTPNTTSVVATASVPNHIQRCPLDCGAGGMCVPDPSPTFGALLAQHHSGTTPFRCHCFEGYSGALCQVRPVEGAVASDAGKAMESERGYDDDNNDGWLPGDFVLTSDGCAFECQNGGQCISIFGGLSFACLCSEPYWGSMCEIDGTERPCELDCGSIVSTDSLLQDSEPKKGAFCVASPSSSVVVVDDALEGNPMDQSCVHCEEILEEDEPNCEDLIDCKNGGACKIDYQFLRVVDTDSSQGNEEATGRPLECSSSMTISVHGFEGTTQTVWTAMPPYTLSCDCQPGFQGETCEEIDVCGGCQNDGYCISEDTPGDKFFTDDSNLNDDYQIFTDDDDYDDDHFIDDDRWDDDRWDDDHWDDDAWDDDYDEAFFGSPLSSAMDCVCFSGGCDQTSCGAGVSCMGGMCNQDYLVNPMCSGGKCSQRHTINATCTGGDCDQTSAVEATCSGSDCFHDDDFQGQTIFPDSGTMPPDITPFCLCKYGYFGDLCEHSITTICLFDDLSNQMLHEFCLNAVESCPLDLGDRFCANEGSCNSRDKRDVNEKFRCDCPIGFDGVHCEIVDTQAPSGEPTAEFQPTRAVPNPYPRSSAARLPRKWPTLEVFVVLAIVGFVLQAILCFYYGSYF